MDTCHLLRDRHYHLLKARIVIKFFQWLWRGHVCKWKILHEGQMVSQRIFDPGDEGRVCGRWYDCQCEICGRVKGFNT